MDTARIRTNGIDWIPQKNMRQSDLSLGMVHKFLCLIGLGRVPKQQKVVQLSKLLIICECKRFHLGLGCAGTQNSNF